MMAGNKVTLAAIVLGCAGLLLGCNASSNAPLSNTFAAAEDVAKPGSREGVGYKIGPLDVLDISVFKVPELSKTVQVADAGTINLPLVGEIRAGGMTAQEVERDLTARLDAKYLRKPQVTVLSKNTIASA